MFFVVELRRYCDGINFRRRVLVAIAGFSSASSQSVLTFRLLPPPNSRLIPLLGFRLDLEDRDSICSISNFLGINGDYTQFGISRKGAEDISDQYCAIFFDKEKVELIEGGTFWLSESPSVAGSTSESTTGRFLLGRSRSL